MNESSEDRTPSPTEQLRTEEPQAPYGADEANPSVVSDETVEQKGEHGEQDEALPGEGGYGDRDPKTDIPAVPSAQKTQDEVPKHEGQPDDKERWASE